MAATKENIESAIKQYIDPWLEQDLVSTKSVKKIEVDGETANIDVVLGFPAKGSSEPSPNPNPIAWAAFSAHGWATFSTRGWAALR